MRVTDAMREAAHKKARKIATARHGYSAAATITAIDIQCVLEAALAAAPEREPVDVWDVAAWFYTLDDMQPHESPTLEKRDELPKWALLEHEGDCTDMPWTCSRCVAEEMLRKARLTCERYGIPTTDAACESGDTAT